MIKDKSIKLLEEYQSNLVVFGLDDSSPAYLLSSYPFKDREEQIQLILEFIFNSMDHGLIYHRREPKNKEDLIALLKSEVDFSHRIPIFNWFGYFLDGTPRLDALLEKYNMKYWDAQELPVNMAFLLEAFEESAD